MKPLPDSFEAIKWFQEFYVVLCNGHGVVALRLLDTYAAETHEN